MPMSCPPFHTCQVVTSCSSPPFHPCQVVLLRFIYLYQYQYGRCNINICKLYVKKLKNWKTEKPKKGPHHSLCCSVGSLNDVLSSALDTTSHASSDHLLTSLCLSFQLIALCYLLIRSRWKADFGPIVRGLVVFDNSTHYLREPTTHLCLTYIVQGRVWPNYD